MYPDWYVLNFIDDMSIAILVDSSRDLVKQNHHYEEKFYM